MGERLEVNNSVGAPAVVGVQDEVAVEVTSIEAGEWQTISWMNRLPLCPPTILCICRIIIIMDVPT